VDELHEFTANEPGMNFISVDFELIMVNRTNERVYGKPAAALLGKKCYREFERREEPCPHCPGRLALSTGESQATEAIGLHADGTRLYARIRAHPVLGPDNRPTGFIEVVEDISEQKRAERVSSIETDLKSALASVKNVPRALREVLEAAQRIEGIGWGCVFLANRGSAAQDLVYQRGVSPADLQVLQAREDELLNTYGWTDPNRGIVRIPIDRAIDLVAQRGLPAATKQADGETKP